MKTGAIISGAAHGIFLLLLIIGLPWGGPEPRDLVLVTEVTTMTTAEFEAAFSNEPLAPELDFTNMAQPETDVNDAERPQDTAPPEETEIDVTEAPTERDTDPDLTALEQVVQPEVAIETDQPDAPETPDIAPSVSQNTSPVVGLGTNGNSSSPALSAPPTPRSAPRIDSQANAPAPPDAQPDTQVVEETAPDETATDPAEELTATAPEESVTQIEIEAQPDATPSAAPPRATRPPRRSANLATATTEIEDLVRDQEEQAIRDLLDEALAAAVTEEPAPAASLSAAQKRGIGEAVSQNWNKSIVLGKENYESLVIRLSVSVGPDGTILGNVQPVEPANPTGDFQIAFDAARRAVLRAGTIPLPAGQYPDGVRLILRFDPILGIGLN